MKNILVSIGLVLIFLCSSFSVAVFNAPYSRESVFDDDIFFDRKVITDVYSREANDNTLIIGNSSFSNSNQYNDPIISNNLDDDDALMDSCWPMKSQNRRHTGLSPYSTEDNNGMVKWSYEFGRIESGIVIDDEGTIYFGDFDRYLNAINPDGTLKWQYKTDEWIWSTPALASDGTVYIGTFGDSMFAINSNGTMKWEFSAGRAASISSSPAISIDGIIYFGAMGPNPEPGDERGRIYALNPDGTEKWHYDTGYWIVSDPAIGSDGTIYIGSGDSYFYAMNPDGTLQWRFKTGDIVKTHPSIAEDGTIYSCLGLIPRSLLR